jgi:hypothetical protein
MAKFKVTGATLDEGVAVSEVIEAPDYSAAKEVMRKRRVAVESISEIKTATSNRSAAPAAATQSVRVDGQASYLYAAVVAYAFMLLGSISFIVGALTKIASVLAPIPSDLERAAAEDAIANAQVIGYAGAGLTSFAIGVALLLLRQIALNTRPRM